MAMKEGSNPSFFDSLYTKKRKNKFFGKTRKKCLVMSEDDFASVEGELIAS